MRWFNPAQKMFDRSYGETPTWDIGHPRQQFVDLHEKGEIAGSVLDIGCGTGELALYLAGRGLEVWGIDFSPLAIQKAQQKAAERGIDATFRVQNALLLGDLHRVFDTATDSGFFHTLDSRERPAFERGLWAVLRPGGRYFMLCFSDAEPAGYGPRRVSEPEIRNCFRDGWTVDSVEPTTFESSRCRDGAKGWLASITKNR